MIQFTGMNRGYVKGTSTHAHKMKTMEGQFTKKLGANYLISNNET